MPKSIYEEYSLNKLKITPSVVEYIYEPFSIPYKFLKKVHDYTPDLLVEYSDSRKVIIEIKNILEVCKPENITKFKAANEHAKDNGQEFIIWVFDYMKRDIWRMWKFRQMCRSDYYKY